MLLTLITFLPLLGALVLLAMPGRAHDFIRRLALAFASVELALSILLYFEFDSSKSVMQAEEQYPWIGSLGISYHLGVDGLSVLLIILMTFLTLLSIIAAWTSVQQSVKSFFCFILLLETSVIGVFVSLDLVLFYVFWEAMLIPMYFLIGGWGGPRRVYAAVQFFIYTIAGSLLMLVAIIAVRYVHGDPGTFDLMALLKTPIKPEDQTWLFLAFALAFAVKVPLFPLHTWLPAAYVEAPTPATVLLACVMSKVGAYGFLRFCLGLFPTASREFAGWIGLLAVISILYGAYLAITRPDMKGLIAYSSLGHLGLIVLGVFALTPEGIAGSVIQMVNHGISTGLLFFMIAMLYDRWGSRTIVDFGGLHKSVPALSLTLLVALLASMGLPGLNGFVGEFLILTGALKGYADASILPILGACGVILAAIYIIWFYRRTFHGELRAPALASNAPAITDLTPRELAIVVPSIVLIIWFGVAPQTLLSKVDASAQAWAARGAAQTASVPPVDTTLVAQIPAR